MIKDQGLEVAVKIDSKKNLERYCYCIVIDSY